ncbi:hypothetical protein CDAR_457681 [Caerostris darwini]|uniref:Uncharacterized protein n=1 Tax=Caerostris darwini TaxID=1538125 RepID=A0AAV4N9B5_9ARAC|nr:hypothetical protein CDAR_457681 [Caerostris darwini]
MPKTKNQGMKKVLWETSPNLMTQAQNKEQRIKKESFPKLLCSLSTCEGSLPSILSLSSVLLDGEDQDLSPLVLPRGDVTARNGIN